MPRPGRVAVALWYSDCIIQDDADWSHRSGFDMAVSGRGGLPAVRGGVGVLGNRATSAATQKRSSRIAVCARHVRRAPPPRTAFERSPDQPSTLYFLNQACI